MKKAVAILVLAVLLLSPTLALASDISGAKFSGVVTVTENSSAETNIATVMTVNTTALQAQGFINATANNTAIQSSSGADIAFMPGYTPGGNPWCLFVPSIGANSQVNDILYTKGVTGGKIAWFPDAAGGTILDDATIEPSDNFSLELKGCINTSTTGNLSTKGSDFTLTVSAPGVITAAVNSPVISRSQTAEDTDLSIYAGAIVRAGQRIDGFSGIINQVAIKMLKTGAPTGTIYIRIRRVSDDAILATMGTKDITTVTAAAVEYTFSDTNLNVVTATDIRVLVEFGGGDTSNRLKIRYRNADVAAGEQGTTYVAGYTDQAWDAYYKLYSPVSVSATGQTSGEKTLRVWADGADLHISIDGAEADNTTTVAVPGNADDWIIGSALTLYIESFDFYKGGNHNCHIEWEYTAGDFIDSTGKGNDLTPTYRGASSSATVSAVLATFAPVAESKAPAYALSEAPAFFTTAPWLSGTFTANITGATYPGHDVIVAIALGGETPEQFLTYILVIILVIAIGLACAWFLATYGRGDTVLVLAIVIFAMLCIGVPLHVVDVWQIYFFVIMAWGIRELEKDSRGI